MYIAWLLPPNEQPPEMKWSILYCYVCVCVCVCVCKGRHQVTQEKDLSGEANIDDVQFKLFLPVFYLCFYPPS